MTAGAVALEIGAHRPSNPASLSSSFRRCFFFSPAFLSNPSTAGAALRSFISERGAMLTGRDCWDHLQTRFQMHPRADVIGLSLNGLRAQVRVRELDFGAAVRVLAYTDATNVRPVAEVKTLYTTDTLNDTLPELLKRYLRRG